MARAGLPEIDAISSVLPSISFCAPSSKIERPILSGVFAGPNESTRSFAAACEHAGGPGKAALQPVHKLVGARQARPRPLYWGPHRERVALAGPIGRP